MSSKSITQPVAGLTSPTIPRRTKNECPCKREHLWPSGTKGSRCAASNRKSTYSSTRSPALRQNRRASVHKLDVLSYTKGKNHDLLFKGNWHQSRRLYNRRLFQGWLAQLGEHLPYKQRVGGSIPSSPTKLSLSLDLATPKVSATWSGSSVG